MGTDLVRRLRQLEQRGDIPVDIRLQWLSEHEHKVLTPSGLTKLKMCRKRLQGQRRQPKYPLFFSVRSIMHWAFGPLLCGADLLDQLITQLRLVTLMRSGDVANVMWGILQFQDTYLIRTMDKSGKERIFNIGGVCLYTLCHYMVRHISWPAPYLCRYIDQPGVCLGAERIAKRFLHVMKVQNVDTTLFKAHALRGAVATYMLRSGIPKEWVQSRGGWSSMATLDMYYNRCHLARDWVSLLLSGPSSTTTMGEDVGDRQTAGSAAQGTMGGMAETSSSEVESQPPERSCEALLAVLAAHGVLKSWQSSLRCPACNDAMCKEASYACEDCHLVYHVRCLSTVDFDIPVEQGGTGKQPLYHPRCTLCAFKREMKRVPCGSPLQE
jgi:hypothetical protein